jgi:hypothetical protein
MVQIQKVDAKKFLKALFWSLEWKGIKVFAGGKYEEKLRNVSYFLKK